MQAAVALVGYQISRVPHPVFFGALTFFCAIIPAGATSTSLVAALILLVTSHPYMALFLAIWGLAAVGMADRLGIAAVDGTRSTRALEAMEAPAQQHDS